MAKNRIIIIALGAALAAAYVADVARHGLGAAWHLVFLIVLVSPKLAGLPYGVDLEAQQRKGTRDYLVRFRGMSADQADRELARTSGIAQCVLLTTLIAVEALYILVPRAWPMDVTPLLWLFLVVSVLVGAVLFGLMVFGVVYAVRHLRT